MKKWYQEIWSGYLSAIGAALLAWTLAAIPQVPRLVLGLSLSDTQVLYIRAGLALFGFVVIALVGWLLYFQTRRQLRLVQVSLAVPHKVSDDYEHLKDRGFWVHRKAGQRVCGRCILPPTEIISPLGHHFERGCKWWQCNKCGYLYSRLDDDT